MRIWEKVLPFLCEAKLLMLKKYFSSSMDYLDYSIIEFVVYAFPGSEL